MLPLLVQRPLLVGQLPPVPWAPRVALVAVCVPGLPLVSLVLLRSVMPLLSPALQFPPVLLLPVWWAGELSAGQQLLLLSPGPQSVD